MEAEERSRGTQRDTHLEIETERPRDRDSPRRFEMEEQDAMQEGQKRKRDPKTERHKNTPRAGHRETQRGERGRHTCTSVNSDTCAKKETSAGRNRWQRQRDPD